nr:lipoyl(octanoyl) transferase LipB [Gemmatimonadaceae bacterium]
MSADHLLLVCDLGTMAYGEALAFQRAVSAARIAGAIGQDVLFLVEHPPVVTLGRSTKGTNLSVDPAWLASRGIELYEVERGGYPIIDLKRHRQDLHWYLRQVEQGLIDALAAVGIAAGRNTGYTGAWVGDRKIASIGVHARDWVTRHGFALNVTTDLSYFDVIVPCGIQDVVMTSVARELGDAMVAPDTVRDAVVAAFGRVFALEPQAVTAELFAAAIA